TDLPERNFIRTWHCCVLKIIEMVHNKKPVTQISGGILLTEFHLSCDTVPPIEFMKIRDVNIFIIYAKLSFFRNLLMICFQKPTFEILINFLIIGSRDSLPGIYYFVHNSLLQRIFICL